METTGVVDGALAVTGVGDSVRRRGGQYLTFFLGDEEFGVGILAVREILGLLPITPVPRAPDWVRGIINLRGKVIPVVDLRQALAMGCFQPTSETCIVVVHALGVEVGMVVDRVSEVLGILEADIGDPPAFGDGSGTRYLMGVARSASRVRLLIELDQLFHGEDFSSLMA